MPDIIPQTFITNHPIIVNIGCSVTASLIFLFVVLALFKPKIKISPFLTQSFSPRKEEGIVHTVKIVNMSIFTAYDVKVEMHVLHKLPTPDGTLNTQLTEIPLVYNYLSTIDGRRPRWYRKNADHCVRFRTCEDVSTMLQDPMASVEVRVILRHGLTGLSNVHTQEYADPSQVSVGKFTSGSAFGLIPPSSTKM
jgi:hypothetical protein